MMQLLHTYDVLCITMTHKARLHLIDRVIQNIRSFTVPCDICIWNNSLTTIPAAGVYIFTGVNGCGEIQKLFPALASPHEYIFYRDDDLEVGTNFLKVALDILKEQPNAIVTAGGSVIMPPFTAVNIDKRVWFYGSQRRNHEPIEVDLGCGGCFVCTRNTVKNLLRAEYRVNGHQPHNCDVGFWVSHHLYNQGPIIVPPHLQPENYGIRKFYPEHLTGLCSTPNFRWKRTRVIDHFIQSCGWTPRAHENYRPAYLQK